MRAVLHRAAVVIYLFGTNSSLVLGQTAPGDFDGDAIISLEDHRAMSDCLLGPGTAPLGEKCAVGDFDCDGDVDLRDLRWIQLFVGDIPPLSVGCCERPVAEFMESLAGSPDIAAAFYDSWQFATELGFSPTLSLVIRCDLSNDFVLFTAPVGSLQGGAALGLLVREDGVAAWAPITMATGEGTLKILNRSGGILFGTIELDGADARGDRFDRKSGECDHGRIVHNSHRRVP